MAIAGLTEEDMKALEDHGHPEEWEIARYGDNLSVTVECVRCGMVLLELIDTPGLPVEEKNEDD